MRDPRLQRQVDAAVNAVTVALILLAVVAWGAVFYRLGQLWAMR